VNGIGYLPLLTDISQSADNMGNSSAKHFAAQGIVAKKSFTPAMKSSTGVLLSRLLKSDMAMVYEKSQV